MFVFSFMMSSLLPVLNRKTFWDHKRPGLQSLLQARHSRQSKVGHPSHQHFQMAELHCSTGASAVNYWTLTVTIGQVSNALICIYVNWYIYTRNRLHVQCGIIYLWMYIDMHLYIYTYIKQGILYLRKWRMSGRWNYENNIFRAPWQRRSCFPFVLEPSGMHDGNNMMDV